MTNENERARVKARRIQVTYGPVLRTTRGGGVGRFEPSLWREFPPGYLDVAERSYRTFYGARMAAMRMWGRK